jgi:phosphoesterase RecJ-like protein
MSPKGRSNRVGELLREEIAKLISKGLKDPRIGFVSVMEVRMSPDLHYANVYVSLFGDEAERKGSLIGLRNSAGWIRREVGKFLRMRYTPEIRFFPDETLDTVYHLEEVFEEIHTEQRQTPMLELTLEQVVEELKSAESLLLTTHINPDGDAVGSLLGLWHLLRALGKTRTAMAMEGAVPRIYATLPGVKRILNEDADTPSFDTAVILDCSSFERIGAISDWIEPAAKVIVIDHHRDPGPSGTMGHIDPEQAATGELLMDLYDAAGVEISPEAALCLYVAQITDTGGFRFSNTTARSHEKAARLVRTGIDVGAVNNQVFNQQSRAKFGLMGRVIAHAAFHEDGAWADSWLSPEDFQDAQATGKSTEGLVNLLKNVDDVRVAALFTACEPGKCKVSLRSGGGFDCAAFLRQFGGGGHVAAAGASFELSLDAARERVLAALGKELAASPTGSGNGADL